MLISELNAEYEAALAEYLGGASEVALLKASSLGKRALTGNLGVLDVVVLHHESLAWVLNNQGPLKRSPELLSSASTFLCEALASFEITHQAFEEVTVMMNRFIQFAHVVCHELRTPLTSLLCSVGVLKEVLHVLPDSIEKRLLSNIMLSTDTLKKRTDDLLDLVGLQSGTLTVKQTTMKPGEAIGNVLARMNEQITIAGLKVSTHIGELPDIKADPGRYEQILTNLLQNAVKYGSDGGVIEVRAYERERSVVVEIEDHGRGMSAWERLNMFHPSYRSPRYSNDVPDLGIGLALCKELVTHLSGAITFDTKEGEGSIFRVELPQA